MSVGAKYLELFQSGWTYRQIAEADGITRNAVAGAIHRHRHHHYSVPAKFRDPDRVASSVALADQVGLLAAARRIGMDPGQLCRWRQKVRSLEASA